MNGGARNARPATRYRIRIEGNDRSFACAADQRLLVAMEVASAGASWRDWMATIPVGCRRGGCGVCRVRVLEGEYETAVMSARQVSPEDKAQGFALACCLYPRGDLRVALAPRGKTQGAAARGRAPA